MKRRLFPAGALLGALFAAWSASAACAQTSSGRAASLPSAETVLDQATRATGGAKALANLSTLVTTGTASINFFVAFSTAGRTGTGTFDDRIVLPNREWSTTNIPNLIGGIDVIAGNAGWDIYEHGVKDISTEELAEDQFSAAEGISNWRGRFDKVEMLGLRKIGSATVYALRMTPHDLVVYPRIYYFDVRSKHLICVDRRQGATHLVAYFSDFRPVGGLVLPFCQRLVNSESEFVCQATQIKINARVDPALFVKPTDPATKFVPSGTP